MNQARRTRLLSRRQRGFSLIEVMIAVLITAIGLLGAAAMQLNALKYTDSSRVTSQASFIVYDIIDRMRAADPTVLDGYDIDAVTSSPSCSGICAVDLQDFIDSVNNTLPGGEGSINVDDTTVRVEVSWAEGRAGGKDDSGNARRGSFSVTTDVAVAMP